MVVMGEGVYLNTATARGPVAVLGAGASIFVRPHRTVGFEPNDAAALRRTWPRPSQIHSPPIDYDPVAPRLIQAGAPLRVGAR